MSIELSSAARRLTSCWRWLVGIGGQQLHVDAVLAVGRLGARLGQTPCADVVALLERRADEIGQRIAELQRLQGDMRRLAARAQGLDPAD